MSLRRPLITFHLRSQSSLPISRSFRPPSSTPRRSQSSTSSSTSALAYKALHRRISPLPTADAPPAWSAPAAVSSILYETPSPSVLPPKRHVLNCLVQNEPGVLSRVSGILAARGFNIDSLVVCKTEVEDLSRMTIVLSGHDGVVEQARRQLEDLVPVWAVLDYTSAPLVQRELLLAKISILGPEYFEELLAHHREITATDARDLQQQSQAEEERRGEQEVGGQGETQQQQQRQETPSQPTTARLEEMVSKDDFHPSKLAASEALRHKHEHLEAITHLTHQFGGKVLDISLNNCIVEIITKKKKKKKELMLKLGDIYSSAKPNRIDSFMKLIAPFGILESARTGLMAMPRTPFRDASEGLMDRDAGDVVDASTMPPG
ncbi:MAG: hypothetical protein M1816_005876 [Peltula sp. TS41687]|nr:MAG: hypothetical protein M1816_005876 [Peltula sp. TS41687]